jgi:hypothetical protein
MSSSSEDESSDSTYQEESEKEKQSESTETEEENEKKNKSTESDEEEEKEEEEEEEEDEEEREPFTCIDVNTDDTVVGARGCDITFLSPTGQFKKGYKAKYSNKELYTPTKLLLHSGGEKLLTLTPEKDVICRLDTETGKNIGQMSVKLFHPDLSASLDTVVPLKKFSHLESQNDLSLAAICGNTLSKIHWDTRLPVVKDYVLDTSESLTKAMRFRFTAITTTKEGHIAVGSKDGSIRLYTGGDIVKRAKTELCQLGDQITGLDVSCDSEWLLGTTVDYLIVFKTTWSDQHGEHNAFKRSIPIKEKSVMVLTIPKEYLKKHKIKKLNFTPARFDSSPLHSKVIEEEIVTSTGPFIVRFKFRKVKVDYQRDRIQLTSKPIIYKQEENIVDKTFSYNGDCIVAALCHDLKKIDLSQK